MPKNRPENTELPKEMPVKKWDRNTLLMLLLLFLIAAIAALDIIGGIKMASLNNEVATLNVSMGNFNNRLTEYKAATDSLKITSDSLRAALENFKSQAAAPPEESSAITSDTGTDDNAPKPHAAPRKATKKLNF